MSDLRRLKQQVLDDLPASFEETHLTPGSLGARLALCAAYPSAFDELRTEIQRRLLHVTVGVCRARSPLFREILAGVEDAAILSDGAIALPVTSREHLEAPQDRLCLDNLTLDFCCFTSGSTTGRSLIIYRSKEEQAFLREMLEVIRSSGQGAPGREDDVTLGLLRTNPHGRSMNLGPPLRLVVVTPFETDQDYVQAERLLGMPFLLDGESRRISRIAAPTFDVIRLTGLLLRHGRHDLAEHMRRISFTGRMASRREYRMVCDFWQCQVANVFSMSEMYTSCLFCDACEGFHFDPYALYEVLDADTMAPVSEGRGRLAVTGLYPLNQMTPFLRYLNGDVVEVWHSDCPLGPRTFRPLGRYSRTVRVTSEGGRDLLLCPGDVLDLLDELPDVRRSSIPGLTAAGTAEWGWLPIFQLRREGDQAHIAAELRFDPAMFPDRAGSIRQTVEQEIAKASPALGRALATKALAVDLLAPGALSAAGSPEDLVRRRRDLLNDPVGIGGLPV